MTGSIRRGWRPSLRKGLVVAMRREGRARGRAILLAHHLLPLEGIDLGRSLSKNFRLVRREEVGKHEITGLVKPVHLITFELHDLSASTVGARSGKASPGLRHFQPVRSK